VLNVAAVEMEELVQFFAGYSPVNLTVNRTNESIQYDCSALENITLAILSDR
jgi:hypothetical protein